MSESSEAAKPTEEQHSQPPVHNLAPLASENDPCPTKPSWVESDVWKRHTWDAATSAALAKIYALRSQHIERIKIGGEDVIKERVNLASDKFDIWAARYVLVVADDVERCAYHEWLMAYANSWIDLYRQHYAGTIEFAGLVESLRSRLLSRIEAWKGASFAEGARNSSATAETSLLVECQTSVVSRAPGNLNPGATDKPQLQRSTDRLLLTIRRTIMDLRAANFTTTADICKELDSRKVSRPPNAAWRDQTWTAALKSSNGAVTRWISAVK